VQFDLDFSGFVRLHRERQQRKEIKFLTHGSHYQLGWASRLPGNLLRKPENCHATIIFHCRDINGAKWDSRDKFRIDYSVSISQNIHTSDAIMRCLHDDMFRPVFLAIIKW
jgi:hypothetical protein